jgi:hypothetical protein
MYYIHVYFKDGKTHTVLCATHSKSELNDYVYDAFAYGDLLGIEGIGGETFLFKSDTIKYITIQEVEGGLL